MFRAAFRQQDLVANRVDAGAYCHGTDFELIQVRQAARPEEETTRRIGSWSELASEKPVLAPDGTALLRPSDGRKVTVWDSGTLAEVAVCGRRREIGGNRAV